MAETEGPPPEEADEEFTQALDNLINNMKSRSAQIRQNPTAHRTELTRPVHLGPGGRKKYFYPAPNPISEAMLAELEQSDHDLGKPQLDSAEPPSPPDPPPRPNKE